MSTERCIRCGNILHGENKCDCEPYKVYDPEYYGEEEKLFMEVQKRRS